MAHHEKLGLMKELLEHMGDCCDQWQFAERGMQRVFADSLRRDLREFRRLCDSLLSDRRENSPALAAY